MIGLSAWVWNGATPTRGDTALGLTVAVALVLEAGLRGSGALSGAAALSIGLALVWRRGAPVVATTAVVAIALARPEEDSSLTILPFVLALYSCGAYAPPPLAIGIALASALGLTLSDSGTESAFGQLVANTLYYALLSGAPVAAGMLVSHESSRVRDLARLARELDHERELRAQEAVDAERSRMARELHDVVAHAINVVGIHATAARLAEDDSARERALGHIEHAAEQASDEMRRLLGVLRQDGEASPLRSIPDIRALVQQARDAGAQVRLSMTGPEGAVSSGVGLTCYRIVQEALTNARKHAPGAAVDVSIEIASDVVCIRVRNPLTEAPRSSGASQGLIGMRERCRLYGGKLETHERDGGFDIEARLPLGPHAGDEPTW